MNKSKSKYFNTATKMNIALISLLKKKSFEYITVSEICKTAGVHRSTFYLHYETIGDLLNETARYLLDDFSAHFTPDVKSSVKNLKKLTGGELIFIDDKYLIPYLTYIQENQELFRTALCNVKILGLEDVYKRLFENIFAPILDKFNYPADIQNYVMMYYLNGINAIILEWLQNECDKPVKEISKIISICIYGKGTTNA